MAILNVGSINRDRILRLRSLPRPGETIAALAADTGLGGKGLNQTVAIARAGGDVRHLGAVGAGDPDILERLRAIGIDCDGIVAVEGVETGVAIILLDEDGENSIVLVDGANRRIPQDAVARAIDASPAGDWLLVQNETNLLDFSVDRARAARLRVAFAAAPFDAAAVVPLLDRIDLLAVNDVEFAQLGAATDGAALPDGLSLLITRGRDGAEYRRGGQSLTVAAHAVEPRDTTGAGDTFFGYFLAALDRGMSDHDALALASAAAAIQVTRPGAVTAIPGIEEVRAFLDTGDLPR